MKIIKLEDYKKAMEGAVEVIRGGGLVVFPSDTIYGLAVDVTNQGAVDKLLGFKDRWTGKAISVAVVDKKMAKEYVELNEEAKRIYDNLLPGPFTVISKGRHKMAKGIEAEDGTLGVRIADNKFMVDLAKKLGSPFTSTSANLAGRSGHLSVGSFLKSLSGRKKKMIDLVINGGKLPQNKSSTVINTVGSEIEILRRGDLVVAPAVAGLTEQGQSLVSKSEAETKKIAEFLVKKNMKGGKALVFGLTGDLGAGKTVFAKGVGRALGIKERIKSPTFVICNEYDKGKFLHFDLYRIEKEGELEELDFLNLFLEGEVTCIEWPEKMGKEVFEKLKKKVNYVGVRFEYVDKKTREIMFEGLEATGAAATTETTTTKTTESPTAAF